VVCFKNDIKKIIKKILSPRSSNEYIRRQEFILNILLFFSIIAFIIINIIRLIDIIGNPADRGLPIIYTLLILGIFIFLLWLSKKGKSKISAWLLIIVYSLPMFYSFIFWGADVPAALLLAVLVITLFGVLISARMVLISTLIINIFLIILTYHQSANFIKMHHYWRLENHEVADAIVYAVLSIVIALIAWLFAKEIEKAMIRVKNSELALKKERDSLEIKVQERTKKIRQIEADKINQLYRLAEFGRLSSGIFHDLINPLTAVSLNLEQIHSKGENKISDAKNYLSQAILATRKMEDLIISIKKQIQQDNNCKLFSINKEIEQIIQILAYKARRADVQLIFSAGEEISYYGNASKLGQIITNLICNSIESYDQNSKPPKSVQINLTIHGEEIIITIADTGCGIKSENLEKIFDHFFSTKQKDGRGLGIGLASAKHLIERDFKGKIKVSSQVAQGTKFLINFPQKHEN